MQRASNCTISDNIISYTRRPIVFFTNSTTYPTADNTITRNIVTDTLGQTVGQTTEFWTSAAISMENASANMNYGNIISYNYITRCTSGLHMDGKSAVLDPNIIAHNTVVDCGRGIHVRNDADYHTIRNNIFIDSVEINMYLGTGATNCVINNNMYYPDGETKFFLQGSGADNFADWQTNTSQDANSSIADPLILLHGRIIKSSPAVDTGIWIDTINEEGQADPWGKYIHRLPNIGADQGAGSYQRPKTIRIGGGGIN